ncbi:ATP-binding protein [Marinobacter zhanjiangensis]|uniref:histidine kinase n=1 Tax=Marinobacter zhanjiangensis TaxID=578215 RepID=A0ABQ3B3M7_9GAMM|nr:ATP-binding protein [Marinobacter zhanjiangensis]GGY78402.1 hypothetical protein GCM10007071_27120 [Marinobacter zhanjiangensis]
MRRSIRSSLFLLVAPFALTFTLLAWVVHSKIGPWLAQPLIANCSEKGYSEWVCNFQAGLMPWLFLGAGILILLSVSAALSLGLFQAHLKELQQDVLDFQKGHRNALDPDAPREISPLVQLLNRILQAGAGSPPDKPAAHTAVSRESLSSDQNRPVTPREHVHTDRRFSQPIAPAPRTTPEPARPEPPAPEAASPGRRRQPEPPPERTPPPAPPTDPEDTEELEVSLEELDADIDKALKEEPPEPPPEPQQSLAPAAGDRAAPQTEKQGNTATTGEPQQTPPVSGTSKNMGFPARKCRKLIAMLGQRYPDVNFDLITDVTENDPWTIREAELTEVFGQLLDNAGKWAESQVNVFLAIKGNMLVFGVSDDGPGVDPELTQHMGEEGFRINEDQPAGKGLVTVRQVLDARGGSLAFDRSRLGGLEVIAAIPGSPLSRNFATRDAYR